MICALLSRTFAIIGLNARFPIGWHLVFLFTNICLRLLNRGFIVLEKLHFFFSLTSVRSNLLSEHNRTSQESFMNAAAFFTARWFRVYFTPVNNWFIVFRLSADRHCRWQTPCHISRDSCMNTWCVHVHLYNYVNDCIYRGSKLCLFGFTYFMCRPTTWSLLWVRTKANVRLSFNYSFSCRQNRVDTSSLHTARCMQWHRSLYSRNLGFGLSIS